MRGLSGLAVLAPPLMASWGGQFQDRPHFKANRACWISIERPGGGDPLRHGLQSNFAFYAYFSFTNLTPSMQWV